MLNLPPEVAGQDVDLVVVFEPVAATASTDEYLAALEERDNIFPAADYHRYQTPSPHILFPSGGGRLG
jgi:hypothetical protein